MNIAVLGTVFKKMMFQNGCTLKYTYDKVPKIVTTRSHSTSSTVPQKLSCITIVTPWLDHMIIANKLLSFLQLTIEARIGGTGYSDTAIDDVFIDPGHCGW